MNSTAMRNVFTKRFKKICLLIISIFVLLFVFRLAYGYTLDTDDEIEVSADFDYFDSDKRNIASSNYKNDQKSGFDKGAMDQVQRDFTTTVDQKYEKIADVKSGTHQFEEDEDFVRNQVELFKGMIQYERKYGNEGYRKLQLQIGVPPENFDSLYTKLIGVGKIDSKEIIKHDKTNEYLELNAKKVSLEKTHASLLEFKQKGGKIDEYVNLENRILEIEVELQELGVNLGDFDESNEFCTVKFALSEVLKKENSSISFIHRCKVALQWTISWFSSLMVGLFFMVLFVYILMLIAFKFKPSKSPIDGGEEKER